MGKESRKKKKQYSDNASSEASSQGKSRDNIPIVYDKDTAVFISRSRELRDEGNKMFQKRDHEGAMLKYEKALKLLPRNHIDVSYLRSNMAACYMQMGLIEYPRAIHECNLALDVTPKYSKALLKRARCYEGLNRLDLALRDVNSVLKVEPNNLMALEIQERVKNTLEMKGLKVNNDYAIELALDTLPSPKWEKEKTDKKKKKKKKMNDKVEEEKTEEKDEEKKVDEVKIEDKKAEDKLVVEERITSTVLDEVQKNSVKLVFGEDIRLAHFPIDYTLLQVREVIHGRFPCSRAVLIKYKDEEGDLVTITSNEELRWAEKTAESRGLLRLYVVEVKPEQDPFFEKFSSFGEVYKVEVEKRNGIENEKMGRVKEIKQTLCIEDWIIEFAQLFKNHVGFETDSYLDLHELGMKVYSEAIEETTTSEEAQELFEIAAEKFNEMAALALFNWGNVHMSRARKRAYFGEDGSKDSLLKQIKSAYDLAQKEYVKAGERYKEAVEMKPDFYEGLLALGQLQFELAKLSWYYAIGNNVDLRNWPYEEVLSLYNNAEDNMEKGMQIWEEWEEQRKSEASKQSNMKSQLQKMRLNGVSKDLSENEAEEQAASMRSHINLVWGTMLYERSILEFKLGLLVWNECLEVAIEKFELAGASPTDIAVMIKNHCSNNDAIEGLGFKIDEIVQAWNEMYEAKKLGSKVPSFRLEPLFRRRVSKIYHVLEQI